MSRKNVLMLFILISALLISFGSFSTGLAQETAPASNLIPSGYPVFLQPQKLDVLSAEISGLLTQINHRPQEFVKKDAVIMKLDDQLYRMEIDWIQTQIDRDTSVEEAKIVEEFSKRNLEIIEKLAEDRIDGVSVGSPKELYDARQRYQMAQLEARKAQLKLKELQYNRNRNQYLLGKTSIRASFDGVIVPFSSVKGVPSIAENLKAVEVGEVVQAHSPVSALMKVDRMKISLPLKIEQIDYVKLGQKAKVYVQHTVDEPLAAEVVFISPTISSTGQFNVRFEFENPPADTDNSPRNAYPYRFRPGMRAIKVELITD